MKRGNRRRQVKPSDASAVVPLKSRKLLRSVELTPRFLACAESWFLTPEELARRVCEDFELNHPPGSPVRFQEYIHRQDAEDATRREEA